MAITFSPPFRHLQEDLRVSDEHATFAVSNPTAKDFAAGASEYFYAAPCAGTGDEHLLVYARSAGDDTEVQFAFRLRPDFVERVGGRPLMLMQELAQEIGVPVEVGRQRNRFIYAERVAVESAPSERSVAQLVQHPGGLPSGTAGFDSFRVKVGRVENAWVVDVEMAFSIPLGAYQQWLDHALPRVEYQRSFISYGEPDADFAEQLGDELTRNGVDCWLYRLDATFGARSWKEITEEIKRRDRLVVVCSARALVRDGMLKEVESAIDEDPNKILVVSLDDIWLQDGFPVRRGGRDLKPFLAERNYADFSKKRNFGKNARRLLDALRKV